MTKREAVVVLLRTRTAWHRPLRSQFATFGALPGETATEWRMCGSCDGEGHVRGRKGFEPCSKCGGQGRFQVDAYTGKQNAELTGGKPFTGSEREQWRRLTDASIARLRQQNERMMTEADLIADAAPYPWERERDRHYRAGDYAALDRALEQLPPHARDAIRWVYETDLPELAVTVLAAAEHALDILVDLMPEDVRVPVWLRPRTAEQEAQITYRTLRSNVA